LLCGTVVLAAAAEFIMILFSLLFACSSCMYFVFLLLLLGVVTCVVVLWNLYLPLLHTYPCQQPASIENFNCEQLTMFSSITTLPFGDRLVGWLVGWLSSWFFALVVVVPING
jgi:hypothetical protein